ncbi:MAG: molybdate transport system substrate-binding protein [Acetobacteraceae bacterium]|nr:molybdate transport system substrate-binding protein [Acetobacteraceae bacterium]
MIRWLALFLLLVAPARAADLTVLSAGAINSVAAALTPAFEASSGNKVTLRNDTVGGLLRRIAGGETFDVVLMSPTGLDELAKAGKIASGSSVRLARVGIGVGIKTGSPPPDIATVAAFKTAMLHARAVAYIDPASGGSSGIYLAKLFQTMGIADAMAPKSVLVKGGLAATAVVDGRADIVVQQISEVIAVPGITLVGPLPAEIQNQTIYAGAVAAGSAASDAARAFLAALTSPAAKSVLATKGMTPP